MDLGLKGKAVIVTGGASGIGQGIVEGFVKEEASVVIADISLDTAQRLAEKMGKRGSRVIAIRTDVSKKSDADNLAATTMKEFGRIDILVNNAGVGPRMAELVKVDDKEWDRVNDVNVKGLHKVTRAVVPHMIAARYGKVVNLSSVGGKMGFPSFGPYIASKFAVLGYTQTLAQELAQYNINVNAVCPGIVRTPMWEKFLDDLTETERVPRDVIFGNRCEAIQLGRPQTLEDMANAVLFLSSEVSRNTTGEAFSVNGGMRMD